MPVVLQPVNQPIISRDDIRQAMRDYWGKITDTGVENTLLDKGPEFSDSDIDLAIRMTVHRYNAIPPVIGTYRAETINPYVLLIGAVCFLLNSESWRQARGQTEGLQDGDATTNLDAKAPLYSQLAQLMCEEFKEMVKANKTQQNMDGAWGGIGSGYRGTSRSVR